MSLVHPTTPTLAASNRTTSRLKLLSGLAAITMLLVAVVGPSIPSASAETAKPTIVLLHGAFADASGWNDVTQRLQKDGYTVIAPANPLRGVSADATYVRSLLDQIDGPMVVVGHSYGGFVLTNAATGDPDVEAIVYVAAFAPAAGETVGQLTAMNPGSGLGDPANLIVRGHPGGAEGYINPATFREIFAADLSAKIAAAMAASQRPADLNTLFEPSGPPAWASIPSWYVVASQDRTIPPATQRFMAQRAGSTTVEITSSHVAMTSHPKQVADVIEQAAVATS